MNETTMSEKRRIDEVAQDRGDEYVHDRVMDLFFAGVLRFLERGE